MDEEGFFCLLFALDENSEPKLLCQEDTESQGEITGYGLSKFWFVFMCMCQTNRRCLARTQGRMTEKDCGLCF